MLAKLQIKVGQILAEPTPKTIVNNIEYLVILDAISVINTI